MQLVRTMADERMVISCSMARRAICQGAVKINGEPVTDLDAEVQPGDIVQIGKREAKRIGERPDSKSGAQ